MKKIFFIITLLIPYTISAQSTSIDLTKGLSQIEDNLINIYVTQPKNVFAAIFLKVLNSGKAKDYDFPKLYHNSPLNLWSTISNDGKLCCYSFQVNKKIDETSLDFIYYDDGIKRIAIQSTSLEHEYDLKSWFLPTRLIKINDNTNINYLLTQYTSGRGESTEYINSIGIKDGKIILNTIKFVFDGIKKNGLLLIINQDKPNDDFVYDSAKNILGFAGRYQIGNASDMWEDNLSLKFENLKFTSVNRLANSKEIYSAFLIEPLFKFKSKSEVIQKYGINNVKNEARIDEQSGQQEYSTTIYPDSKDAIKLVWDKSTFENLNNIETKVVYANDGSPNFPSWKTEDGLYIGMPLKELGDINTKPVTFYGFEWDNAGAVINFNNGSLDLDKIHLSVGYIKPSQFQFEKFNSKYVGDDKQINSNDADIVKMRLNLFVSDIIIFNPQPKDTASNVDGAVQDENKVFTSVEQEAQFPGGNTAFNIYLKRNLNTGIASKNGVSAGTYTVTLKFIVGKDGSISDINALSSLGHGIEDEAVRVIKNGPKWLPALQDGHNVNSYHTQGINFVVP